MRKRLNILGLPVDALTLQEAVDFVEEALEDRRPRHIVTANPEILFAASQKARLAGILRHADLVTADGVGVLLAAQILGEKLPERVTGIELAEALFARGQEKGWTFGFLGAAPGVVEEARNQLHRSYPSLDIVYVQHGYFKTQEEGRLVNAIAEQAPDILLVGLGSPRQDYFIEDHADRLGASVLIGVGGSFDVFSGRVRRAPDLIRHFHLEWLYRIVRNPKRWKRSLALPAFVIKVIAQRLRQCI